jgi:flagellar protein FlbD
MITLTRLNGDQFMLNIDMIEMMEETPDTVITLTNGKKIIVQESTQKIEADIVRFRKKLNNHLKK